MSAYSMPNVLKVKERTIFKMRRAHDRILELIKYREMHELGHPITRAILSPNDTELIEYVRDYDSSGGIFYGRQSFLVFINKLIEEKEEAINYRLDIIEKIDRIIAGTNDPAAVAK